MVGWLRRRAGCASSRVTGDVFSLDMGVKGASKDGWQKSYMQQAMSSVGEVLGMSVASRRP